ncbi:MAG: aKG-HExxH-type peptide beta-hydroxylase [Parachlamydiaceae bacterium]
MENSYQAFFTSNFVPESPAILLRNYNSKLLKSLSSLVNSVEKSLHTDFAKLKESISNIMPERKIHQTLYTLHAFLQDAIRKGDPKAVIENLKKIAELLEKGEIYASLFSIETISLDLDKEESAVLKDLQEQNRDKNNQIPSLDALKPAEIGEVSSLILESLQCLKQISPSFYHEFETYVARLKLFQSNWLVGMTDVRVFGTIYLCKPNDSIPDQVYFCEHIIHETSHLHLHTLFAIDRIVLNNPSERYTAPIRPDPRPMYGIFHATFVLSRMVRLFMLLCEKASHVFEEYFHLFLKRFLNGYNTVRQFGKLTPLGEKIVESYDDLLNLPLLAHA